MAKHSESKVLTDEINRKILNNLSEINCVIVFSMLALIKQNLYLTSLPNLNLKENIGEEASTRAGLGIFIPLLV